MLGKQTVWQTPSWCGHLQQNEIITEQYKCTRAIWIIIQWNAVSTATNGPNKFGRING